METTDCEILIPAPPLTLLNTVEQKKEACSSPTTSDLSSTCTIDSETAAEPDYDFSDYSTDRLACVYSKGASDVVVKPMLSLRP